MTVGMTVHFVVVLKNWAHVVGFPRTAEAGTKFGIAFSAYGCAPTTALMRFSDNPCFGRANER